jgi:hypothetical protein
LGFELLHDLTAVVARRILRLFFAEWKGGKWVKYEDYTFAVPERDLWFVAPTTTNAAQLSSHCMSYDFTEQDGRKNIGGWI